MNLPSDNATAHGISVVITCFNLEQYIADSIRSVLDQAEPGIIEIIVVDDCSTDRSAELIAQFEQVRYVRTPQNGGVLLAMLLGIEQARHDIVCLLDGDDLWEPAKIAATRAAFAGDPAVALVTHDLSYIDGDGRPMTRASRPAAVIGQQSPDSWSDAVRTGILQHDDYVWLGSALSFRRSVGQLDEFATFARALPDPRNCYQDWPLAYWLATRPRGHMAYIAQPLFRYRVHGSNHSGDARTQERALRNFTRTRNTIDAMVKIARATPTPKAARRVMRGKARFSQALVDLYSGARLRALGGFVRSLGMLGSTGQLAKETARFALGVALGPNLLTRLVMRS